MKRQWWCASCLAQIDLDSHGRCSSCGSDAVDLIKGGALAVEAAKPQSTSRLDFLFKPIEWGFWRGTERPVALTGKWLS